MKSNGAADDWQWTATCYVLGELSADATVRFEALLLENQDAREAVAEAVAILGAAVSRPVGIPQPAPRSRSIAWAWVTALALLVGIAVYLTPKSTNVADARSGQMKEVAADAWLLELPEWLGEQSAVVEVTDAEEAESLAPADDAEGDVPAWLILATSKRGTP